MSLGDITKLQSRLAEALFSLSMEEPGAATIKRRLERGAALMP